MLKFQTVVAAVGILILSGCSRLDQEYKKAEDQMSCLTSGSSPPKIYINGASTEVIVLSQGETVHLSTSEATTEGQHCDDLVGLHWEVDGPFPFQVLLQQRKCFDLDFAAAGEYFIYLSALGPSCASSSQGVSTLTVIVNQP